MMRLVGLAIALAVGAPALAQAAPASGRHIDASLVPESLTPASGGETTLAVVMRPQPGWHGYWRTPGDAGLPTKMSWALPTGVAAGDGAYPVPGTLFIDGIMNHVYEHEYAILVPVRIPSGVANGSRLPVGLKLSYLVCAAEACVPETADISTQLTVGSGTADPAVAVRFAGWRAALPKPLAAPANFAIGNSTLRLAIPLSADTSIVKPHLFVDANDVATFAAPQHFSRNGDMLIVETKASGSQPAGFDAVLDLGRGRGVSFRAQPGLVPANGAPLGSKDVQATGRGRGNVIVLTLIAFGGALLGGLILNVMPCVFPILSLKALNLARSGEDDGSARREAIAYSAGVVLVCVTLGAIILALRAAGSQVGWAFQLQNPGVIFGLILLVGAIAFNLAGLFELSTISAGSSLTAKSGSSGAFWTGALAAFVATPCTGPFMAAALGAAFILPTFAALLIFFGLGIGLSLPFLAIGFIPAMRRALPKPGNWMITMRRILAVPMFVTALGLAWVIGSQTGTTGIMLAAAALLVFSLGLWATGLRQHAFKARAWIPGMVALVISLSFVGLLPRGSAAAPSQSVGDTSTVPFDAEKLAAYRAEGKPVFLYLTADWCLTCKVNERVAIDREETRRAFAKAGVVTMVGDWTGGNVAITRFLEKEGRSGVPMYLWYAPRKEAQVLPQVLTSGMLSGFAEASVRT